MCKRIKRSIQRKKNLKILKFLNISIYIFIITIKKEMRYDAKKQRGDHLQANEAVLVNHNLSLSHLDLQSPSRNNDAQNLSNQELQQNPLDGTGQINNQWSEDHFQQADHQHKTPINISKLYQIDQQEREIEKVAEELITLKEIIKKLKISIGVILQQQIQDPNFHFVNESDSNFSSDGAPLVNAMKKLQRLQDRRITPEYKEWISQYFHKIFNDLKQIKTQFLNYEKAKRKSENIFDLGQEKPNNNAQKPYETLIQYQIKCRLLQCILKLCKYKGIFSSSDQIKYSKELSTFSNQVLIENLQKYKMNNICEKVKVLKNSGPEDLFYQWKTIHDELQILNLQQIQRFYKEKKEISYLNSYENNQNGILIIGGSGVGKTTLFLSLAGEKMIKKKIKSRSAQFENYQAADEQIANQYKTSPFSTSCTREPAKMQAPKKYTFPEQLCLIDTAGFEESRSGQIDIMNTLYTYETIQQMKKLRVIIVISEKNIGERDQGLNKLAKNIARYFSDYEEVRQSILFVLTKFDNIKKLKIACDNILKASANQKDTNEYRFIKHLQESIIYKECIEFRPTDQNIIFDAEYHIDPVEMDGKLKKLYKSLLKRFPIHHEYENDYINLEYSRETKDKLIQKKCYLQNMIRKLYKEGNNNFRFYLEQLMFLQNKINKINNKSKGKYANEEQNTFDILTFIDQINQEVIAKFNDLLQSYFTECNPETLKSILEIKNRYSNLFLGNLDVMIENAEILEEDYQYIFQEITESINSLKIEFDRIVDERQKQIGKMMKYKAKVCHDIKNKKWLCAVLNFTKEYYDQSLTLTPEQDPKQTKQSKNKSKIKKEEMPNKEYKALIKALKKNEQKFKQQFSEELNIMDQEISNYLMKKPTEVETEKEIFQAYNNFKRLVFHQQMFQTKEGKTVIQIPSDQKIFNFNLQYIISILKQNLDKQFEQICQNIELMNMINHSLKDSDPDISRNVFQEVERYSQKIKMYYSCDKPIYELMQSFYNRVMKKVNLILKEINEAMSDITKKQSDDQINVVTVEIPISNHFHHLPHKLHIQKLQRLNSNLLYCYLSKINEIDEFPQLKKQMEFEVRCFNLKLKNYVVNLEKHLAKYDERLSMFKSIIKKEKLTGKHTISLELYSKIKEYIDECIEIEHQTKLIHHYFRNQESKQNAFKFEHLSYIRSIFYRHSRFLESQKKCIKNSYNLTESSDSQQIAFELIIDYMILEEIYIQKIKFDDSHEFKKLHNAYENSFESKIEFINEFEDMKTHELKMLNQCKHRILNKLIEYPLEMEGAELDKIQTEEFQTVFDPKTIKVTVNMFLYYIKLKQIFEDIETLNNEEITHDFRVIELSDISSPLQTIEEDIVMLSNLVATVTQIASLKYLELKESLAQIVLDDFSKTQILNYLQNCRILSFLFDHIEKSSLQGLEILEQNLQDFKRKNLFDQIKQFIDKSESIFYRLSKNIDSIELQHLQNTSDFLDKPQSNKEFLKLLKSQCIFFIQAFENTELNHQPQILSSLKDLFKKMDDSENQMDFLWEDEMKELQKSSKDPKNSLHKLIKLYEHHISKVSTQKTLEYRFVQLKKQQLADEIKQFLVDPAENKVEKGQVLCQQLKSYLNFLKSMKLKMVVNLNGIEDIKNIEQMDRLYEKQASKSQAHKSQTDMTPSEMRQNLLSVDSFQLRRENSERFSVSDIKTSNFGVGMNEMQIQRKPALKNSRVWDEKSCGNSHSQRKKIDHMENPFSNVIDNWNKDMTMHTMEGKGNKIDLTKSHSGFDIRNKHGDMSATFPNVDMTKSGIIETHKVEVDHIKRYTINGPIPEVPNNTASMKKSSTNLKYTPPVLTYQQSLPVKNVTIDLKGNEQKPGHERTTSLLESARDNRQYSATNLDKNQTKLLNSASNQNLHPTTINSPNPNRIMSKHKTQSKLNY